MRQRLLPPVQLVVRRDGVEATVTVSGLTDGDRVADLAAAVGLIAVDRLIIDGQVVGSRQRLAAVDVRRGSVIEAPTESVTAESGVTNDGRATGRATVGSEPAAAMIEWCAGPDSGRRVEVGIGRHIVGRPVTGLRVGGSPAARDARLATHHGLIIVQPGRGPLTPDVTYQDLAGAASSLDDALIDGSVAVELGQVLRVGSSLLRITGPGAAAGRAPSTRPTGSWTQPLCRPPRRLPAPRVSTVELPEMTGSPLGDTAGPGAMALVTAGFVSLEGVDGDAPSVADIAATGVVLAVARGASLGAQSTVEGFATAAVEQRLALVVSLAESGDADRDQILAPVRDNDSLGTQVATVDDLEAEMGVVATVLALADLGHGVVGHYGVSSGADRLLPVWTRT